MIQASELMMNNWITSLHGREQVVDTMCDCINTATLECVPYDMVYGIELSPSILEAAGFMKDKESQYGGYLYDIGNGTQIRIVNDNLIGWIWPLYGDRPVIVPYLHTLQNLCTILGSPHTIKL